MQPCFRYSDPALDAMSMLRAFAGLDAGEVAMPILKFRRLLERPQRAEPGLPWRQRTLVEATLIPAPPSTQNCDRQAIRLGECACQR